MATKYAVIRHEVLIPAGKFGETLRGANLRSANLYFSCCALDLLRKGREK